MKINKKSGLNIMTTQEQHIIMEIAKDAKQKNENVDADTEKKNEEFVENLCRKYKLTYNEGDSVSCKKEKRASLEKAQKFISRRMPVGTIRWVRTPVDEYHFTFQSWKLNENVDAATEKENEEFVENLCRKYGLIYYEGDSVNGNKSKLDVLKRAHELISERMPVGKIKFAHPDNAYYFTFQSWKPKQS